MDKIKNFYKKTFNQINMTNEQKKYILDKIIVSKRRKKVGLAFTACSIFLLCLVGISIVNAEAIKNFIDGVFYSYESKEEWENKPGYGVNEEATGVHSLSINSIVSINKVTDKTKISSIQDFENKVGVKLLKLQDFEYKYFQIFSNSQLTDGSDINANRVKIIGLIEDPAKINIEISNYEDYECANFLFKVGESPSKEEIKGHQECLDNMQKNMPDKRLNISITFATQYAAKKQLEDFVLYFADFPGQEVEIKTLKNLNTNLYITRWNEYIFVYDNIVYTLDNIREDFTKEELINDIEAMVY